MMCLWQGYCNIAGEFCHLKICPDEKDTIYDQAFIIIDLFNGFDHCS
jgi:hypothetical protein